MMTPPLISISFSVLSAVDLISYLFRINKIWLPQRDEYEIKFYMVERILLLWGGGGVVDRNVDNVYVTVLRLADWLYAIVLWVCLH